jgi:hypothetical protein
VVAWLLAQQTAVSNGTSFATYTLLFLGSWGFLSTKEPLYIGLGLLMLLSGIELIYLQTASLITIGFLAAAHLITVIVVTYLAQQQMTYAKPINDTL